ncbi:MFS transporter [Ancylobacter amanitiformis]|uniref:EmrB/QacA subfamily drug resistance transporter n=1 Tax=Ancylobacter amanitiformis TaxID=217069 RepID=A0ABU0LMW0_9HYPH|nr:MFS transporter [Ancylobacter amanitiformis]MDQ0510017.1 EmrB/QacA subfamily drug resistance transporter [Ancylobacter amanitiformis]
MRPERLVPLIVACALFMEQLDSTVIATSLPAIAIDLHEDPIALKLALTSYLLSLAVFIPASGWFADRFGSRTVFRAAIVIFTIGSLLCGLASSLTDFVLYRIIQGMGGAMMVPVGRLVILRTVPKQDIVSALAWLTVPALIGPVLGPPLGGFITTYFDWRYIFFLNIPIGLVGVLLATRFIPDIREDDLPPFDLHGMALSGIGLAGLVFGFALLGQHAVQPWIALVVIVVGAVAMFFYVRHARHTDRPILDLTLLNIPTFFAGVVGASLFRVGIGALPFLLPLMLQLGFGLSPFASGMITFASAAGAMTMKFTAAPIIRAFGFRRVLIVNCFIASACIAVIAVFRPEMSHLALIIALLVGGFFRSLQFTSTNALSYADISSEAMSRATSFASVAQQVSISTGVAVAALVLDSLRSLRGDGTIHLSDFSVAFVVVAMIAVCSVFFFVRLPRDAGAALSGRPRREAAPAEAPGEMGSTA